MPKHLAQLLENVQAYNPEADQEIIKLAYSYAMKMHGEQKRASGDPYFYHPLEVANILTNYRLDTASIATALLHDTVEDTEATIEEIIDIFGDEIGRLVDGVTKLKRLRINSIEEEQAENFRKLFLAISEDIRVLLVKLVDRLHNMRTLYHIKNVNKRRLIALETMEIYAPLSARLGLEEIRSELEDLSFAELHSEARASILRRSRYLERQGYDLVGRIMDELDEVIENSNINAYISGRAKTPYSIWRKMQIKNVSFEQLSDIMAFRIIVDKLEDCYNVLRIIHDTYSYIPGKFKDYISTPKGSGYQSIHTSIIGPQKHRIEIQIRTQKMHSQADLGPAAHWHYKAGDVKDENINYGWLRELLDILEHAQSPEEFLEHTKLEMFQDQIFCFTPKGQLVNLPKGATPIDFAYAVHSEIGNTCVGAKVNGRITPLRIELKTGDQVFIITSAGQKPSPNWEGFVLTAKARSHIRRRIRAEARSEYLELGNKILTKIFRNFEFELNKDHLSEACKKLDFDNSDEILVEIGKGNLMARQVLETVVPSSKKTLSSQSVNQIAPNDDPKKKSNNAIAIKGLIPGIAVHMSECCYPLPGDRIVGIVTSGKGVEIHTIDCDSLISFDGKSERWLDLVWDNKRLGDFFLGRIKLTILNEPGSLGELSTVIAHNQGNISNLKITNRSRDFVEMNLDIEVRGVKHLTDIIAVLRALPVIYSIERPRSLGT